MYELLGSIDADKQKRVGFITYLFNKGKSWMFDLIKGYGNMCWPSRLLSTPWINVSYLHTGQEKQNRGATRLQPQSGEI